MKHSKRIDQSYKGWEEMKYNIEKEPNFQKQSKKTKHEYKKKDKCFRVEGSGYFVQYLTHVDVDRPRRQHVSTFVPTLKSVSSQLSVSSLLLCRRVPCSNVTTIGVKLS